MSCSGVRISNGEATNWSPPPGRRGGDPGTGRAPVLSWATSEETWRGGLSCDAPARAPGGTFSVWARALRAPRSLCGRGPRERRGSAPLRCPQVRYGAQPPRSDALESAIQADPGLRNRAARMGGRATLDADLRSAELWYGWNQNSLDVGPPLDAVFLRDLAAKLRDRKKSAAAVGRRTHAPERSRAWYHLARHGRTRGKVGLGDAELVSAGDSYLVHHADVASPTGRPDQETTEVHVGGEQRHSLPGPVTDGVHEARGL